MYFTGDCDLRQMRRAPDHVRGSQGMLLAAYNRLFAVPKVPFAAQLGPNLCIGIGAHDVAANDHFVLIGRVLIGRLLRSGGPRKQRNAEGRHDERRTERFHRCILRGSAPRFTGELFGASAVHEMRKLAERSSQFGLGNRPIDLNITDEFIRYGAL
jgi:hypothetical protein